MTAALKNSAPLSAPKENWKPSNQHAATHRVYHDGGASSAGKGTWVRCSTMDDATLIELADAAVRIELCQPGPMPKAPAADTRILLEALRALAWADATSNPRDLRRRLRRQIVERCARLRIKQGLHLLAGSATPPAADDNAHVLLLVLTGLSIQSCDYQLTF